jgi:hypothetical protein
MLLALHTSFTASRKEPLAEVVDRIHTAILAAGFGEPHIQFVFSDAPVAGGVSSVDRALKRMPQLERFSQRLAVSPGTYEMKALSNRPNPGETADSADFATLLEIARGVPRSFPFHVISLHFSVPAFSASTTLPSIQGGLAPGITVNDSWWVNGRNRSVSALTMIEADPSAKKLPKPPEPIATLLAACGKVKKTIQAPVAMGAEPQQRSFDAASPEIAQKIRAFVQDYRTRILEIIDRASLPHDLPPNQEARTTTSLGLTSGPRKPELVRNFKPIGYDCRGSSGAFTLRRRTPANLTIELLLDVGTWGKQILAIFRVQGMVNDIGFKATLPLPVARRAIVGGQYPIGDADRWRHIVENLAALAAELDRSFVPAIEAISGPAPDWYQPENDRTI